MNGAHALLATLQANGVTTCFANPGTSEMHFVAGLDDAPGIRAILCLFEGVATGAADGYARISGRPAATLLHLGPGLGNGFANLHNARRARVPLLNIVGDHATYHARFDAPLQSDIGAIASALEGWQRRSESPHDVARDAAEAISAAYGPPGRVATLVLPADVSWGEADVSGPWPIATRFPEATVSDDAMAIAVANLRAKRSALFVGGSATSTDQLALAQRVASAVGARVIMETFPAIHDRGAGVANPERLNYLSEFAIDQLKDLEALVIVGGVEPVGFFAYPNVASRLLPEGCEVVHLAPPGTDTREALMALADFVQAPALRLEGVEPLDAPSGELTSRSFAAAINATITEGLIVSDESNTGGAHMFQPSSAVKPHRRMGLTGGSIGFGLPAAVGAAVASGGRVLALESDGSLMYTPQALWTMAREGLDVTVVALSNRSYAILNLERWRAVAAEANATSQRLLDIDDPTLALADLATSLGVPGQRVTTADELGFLVRWPLFRDDGLLCNWLSG